MSKRNGKNYLALLTVLVLRAGAADFFVAPSGNDANPGTDALPFKTVQKGLDSATAGSNVFLKAGVYNERAEFKTSGTDDAAFITLQNSGTDVAVIDGTGLAAPEGSSALLLIASKSFVRVKGLEFRNYATSTPNLAIAGIRVEGSGSKIEIINCRVHHIENTAPVDGNKLGRDAMGIVVYGTDGKTPISSLLIDGCEVDHCKLGSSESLTVNGNVDGFKITNCKVHDNDNIGIDAIGWEKTAGANDQARNGVISLNTVYNINSKGNPAYGDESSAGGLYVDGGRDILLERNLVYQCDIGIEIGCEAKKKTASGMIVRNNVVHSCVVAGMGFGGYDKKRGTVLDCKFLNNTFFHNDTSNSGTGEVMIQQAKNNIFKHNILASTTQGIIFTNYFAKGSTAKNVFDYNLYFAPGGESATKWVFNNKEYSSFAELIKKTKLDANSIIADPKFADAAALPLGLKSSAVSPAKNAGDPTFTPASGETDYEGRPRVNDGAVDIGAFEY